MDKQILLQRIEALMPLFERYFKVGHIKFTTEQLQSLGEIYKEINPNRRLNYKISCGSCVKDAINTVSNYFSRESKNMIVVEDTETSNKAVGETIMSEPTVSTPEVIESLEEPNVSTRIEDIQKQMEGLDKRSKLYKSLKAELDEELNNNK